MNTGNGTRHTRRFTVRPKPIPSLTKEQFKVVRSEMKRTPSTLDLERIERVKEILKNSQI